MLLKSEIYLSIFKPISDDFSCSPPNVIASYDQIVPVNGLIALYGGWGGAQKILDTMEYWAELNKSDIREFLQQDKTKITKYLYSKSNKEVWYYLIENLDHSFPFEDQYNTDAPAL